MKQASAPLYIRFGEIPKNGKSKIYAGDQVVGEEPGLSVWTAVECNDMYWPLLPEAANENGIADYFDLLLNSDKKVYLVTGDELRYEGQDREPLLQNVVVIKEITHYYRHTVPEDSQAEPATLVESLYT